MANEATDEFASWDKLFERLNRRPRRLQGYRVAAAFILICLIPAARIFQDETLPGGTRPVTRQWPTPLAPVRASRVQPAPATIPPSADTSPPSVAPARPSSFCARSPHSMRHKGRRPAHRRP